jgi:Rieske 2Fe-2S family protein
MLESEYYTSPQRFSADLQLMNRWWQYLGHQSQIPQRGDYLLAGLAGAEVIVARDDQGAIRAFHNVCRHRGLRLCDSRGSVKAALRCPYHGWSYDLSGRLVAAPNMDGTEGFDAALYPLTPIQVDCWNGMVFGSQNPRHPLAEILKPLTPLVANWQIDSLVVAASLDYQVAANWKLIVQNFSECYHCPIVHPQLNRLTPFRSAENQIAGGGPVAGGPMRLAADAQTMSTTGQLAGTPLSSLSDEQKRRVYYYSIFPTLFLSPHPDYVLVHRLHPAAVDATRVECQILSGGDQAGAGAGLKAAVEFWDQTNRQDWAMCERSQQGVRSPGFRPGPYSDLESLLAEFDEFYLKQIEESSDPIRS